jgi:adenylate cyclase
MPDLLAQGPDADQSWRRALPPTPVTLGRTAKSDWQADWDREISGLHATLTWTGGMLTVVPRPGTTNKIFFRGNPVETEFTIPVGEQFVIGRTTFSVLESEPTPSSPLPPVEELTCSRQELASIKFADADQRIEVLASLPGMIRYSPSDQDLASRVVQVLLQGIPRADAAAVVHVGPPTGTFAVEVHRGAFRHAGSTQDIRPSRRLVREAIHRRRQPVMHCWEKGQGGDFTVSQEFDWAACIPLPDDPSPGWALYIAGRLQQLGRPSLQDEQKSDLKFASLVAEIFGSLRQVLDLQKRHAALGSFLSRTVLAALAGRDIDQALAPRQIDVTVLFCDLRGSCRLAEEGEANLAAVCGRMSEALGIMTRNILDKDGVIGDFQGDAAMGFWGWPFAADDQTEQAARAALAIRREFAQAASRKGHPLAGFACGIGIASGPAIAGRLGTADQFKISVFGPVVNLAARLESMTKVFGVPVLLDDRSAQRLASAGDSHWGRCRRVALVQPYGMKQNLMISELMTPAVEPGAMPERDRRDYEAALDAFLAGRWTDAQGLLDRLPYDGPTRVLKEQLRRHTGAPPEAWTGVIEMQSK